MSPARRTTHLLLAFWAALAPLALSAGLSGCLTRSPDKRVLQFLNQEGFGKRYVGNAQEQNYVSIGDTVTFVDTYNEDVRGTQVVDIDGTIILPEAGTVWVAGYTRTELESYLTQKLSPYYLETDVKVTIATGGSKVYYVLGEVGAPGPKPFLGDVTVFEAVINARPRANTANLGRVRLIRADPSEPVIWNLNISDLWETGDATDNMGIREYDIIYVPPTILKQVADVISGIVVPFTSVINSVFQVLFQLDTGLPLGGRGFGRNRGVFF